MMQRQIIHNSNENIEAVPVVICLYKRVSNLSRTLEQISAQQNCRPSVYLWNNSPDKISEIKRIVSQFPCLPVKVHNSPRNVGGFGRFYYAKKLVKEYSKIIFIDDDIDMPANAISDLLLEYEPKSIHSFYAFRFNTKHDYYSRKSIKPGQEADYCGTGGMICDISVFNNDELFKCPKRYWFIEDLWLSYFVKVRLNWTLRKSQSRMTIIPDGLDQWVALGDKKTKFLQYLIAQGWILPKIDRILSLNRASRFLRRVTLRFRTNKRVISKPKEKNERIR